MSGADRAVPLAAGAAVAAGASALAGVLQGWRWLVPTLLAVGLVVMVGLLIRERLRRWWVVGAAQLLALALLIIALFGRPTGPGLVPRSAALTELAGQFALLGHQFDSAVAPAPATGPLLLLACLVFGAMAIVADAFAAAGYAPAACGLVLLCAYTVSTTLSPDALPNWTLATGAAGFALLLVVHHHRRHRSGRSNPLPVSARAERRRDRWRAWARAGAARGSGLPMAMAVTAASVAVALVVGVLGRPIGTEGRFTGNGSTGTKEGVQFALNPFASLHGQLNRPEPAQLLRVRGLPSGTYLRALTLSEYVPSTGWQLPRRRRETVLDPTLPTGLPTPLAAPTATVEIDNVGYRDRWLPLAGLPLGVTGVVPGRWHYDVTTATAYAGGPVTEPHWAERAQLPSPSAAVLSTLPPVSDIDPGYLDMTGIDPRISALSATVTSRADTPFAKAVALDRYLLDPANGFRYSLHAPPGNSGHALVDFLLRTKVGYCEQFASALAVMLRTVGVPSRVAVGFIPGRDIGDVRLIDTSDAHAWVEAFFPGQGWLTFDPTPLGDGRTVIPSYLAEVPGFPSTAPPPPDQLNPQAAGPDSPNGGTATAPPPGQPTPASPSGPSPGAGQGGGNPSGANPGTNPGGGATPGGATPGGATPGGTGSSGAAGPGGTPGGGGGAGTGANNPGGPKDNGANHSGPDPELAAIWRAVLLGLLLGLAVVALIAAPSTVRRLARRRRLAIVAEGGAAGAAAAWREVLAESRDRRGQQSGNLTVRSAGRRLVSTHRLDTMSTSAVRAVVRAVERGWYARPGETTTGAQLVDALRQIRIGMDASAPLRLTDRIWPRSVRPWLLWLTRARTQPEWPPALDGAQPPGRPDASQADRAHASVR